MSCSHMEPTKGDILIVDDEPANLQLLSAMLSEQGYDVRTVINGRLALESVHLDPPDLILLDINLPDVKGYELCRRLKADEALRAIPVIFVSALNDLHDKVSAFQAGGADYITKPFQLAEVLARIENQLVIQHTRKELRRANELLEQRVAERTADLIQANHALQEEIVERLRAEAALRESEARHRALIEAIPDALLRLWYDGTQLDVYVPPDFAIFSASIFQPNTKLAARLPSPLAQHILTDIQRTLATRTIQTSEYHLQMDNYPRFCETRMVAISTNEVMCIIRDITERKRAEETIRRNAARAEALVRIATRLNAQLDLDNVLYTIAEETTLAMDVPVAGVFLYDRASDTLVHHHIVGIPTHVIEHLQHIPRALLRNQAQTIDTVRETHNVRAHPALADDPFIQAVCLRTLIVVDVLREAELVGILLAGTVDEERVLTEDERHLMRGIAHQAAQAITNARLFAEVQDERARLAQRVAERTAELSVANAELVRALRTKDEFLANMSHELRTPLNAILGLAEALQEEVYGMLTEQQHTSLRTIEESGRHLLALINDILDLAKVEAGQVELKIDTVGVSDVCASSLRLVKQIASKKHLRVFEEIDPDVQTIRVDGRRLKQILVNLLTNAVKFTPPDGHIGLQVVGDREQQVVHFMVWDTGIGIDPQYMDRLFQPFVQIDSRLTRPHEGTGLGLGLVARLTELHGGSVTVESEVDRGSRFTVSLPWDPAAPEERAAPLTLHYEEHHAHRSSSSSPNPTILLAEDNENTISMLVDYLELKGFHIALARNGEEAIERAREEHPQLILMDIQMPQLDGLQAIRRIRSDARLAPIPIIALTALTMPGDRERCLQEGADEYLSKPVSLKQLMQMIAKYV